MACVRSVKRPVASVWAPLQELPYLLRNPRVDGAKRLIWSDVTYGSFVPAKSRMTGPVLQQRL